MDDRRVTTSRRHFLASGIALATTLQLQRAARALGFAADAPVCPLAAEQEVGPYYVADEMLRESLAEGRPGVPLHLRLMVLDARSCRPIEHAAIDVWHCDALGVYSGYTKQNPMGPGGPGGPPPGRGFGPPPPGFDPQHPGSHAGPPEGMGPPPVNHPSDKLTFCRGIQLTGSDGAVSFRTMFPGFYMGRTNHIHFKVRVGGEAGQRTYAGGHTSHVGQVFFPEEAAAALMRSEPYRGHAIHRTTQAEDEVFTRQQGRTSVATLRTSGPGTETAGMAADLVVSVDPLATPGPAGRMGGLRPPARS